MVGVSCIMCFLLIRRRPPRSTRTDTLVPRTTLFRSAGGANVKVRGNYLAGMEDPDPADTSIHQMQTGVFFNTSGTTSGADVSGNTFDYITQDAIRFQIGRAHV